MASLRKLTEASQPVINDPIRFDIKSNTRQIVIGEEIELSISARLMNVSPNLMFFLPGSNAYTLKMLLPAGFQQTGGNLTEFVSGELAYPSQPEVTYTVRGYFTSTTENTCFRLLRSHGQATSQSLFVEKATLCLPNHSPDKQGSGRTAATNSSFNWCVEAESGSGNRGVSSSGQASAGQYTGSFGNNTEYMNYTITGVPSAGSYTLHLWYASGDNPQLSIVVNGNLQTISASSNGNWAGPFAEKIVTINLQPGSNSLRVEGSGAGGFNLDRLCVDGTSGGGGCTPPGLSLGTPTCNGSTNYSVSFSAQAGSTISSSAGSVQGNQVVNIPTGTNITITASLNGCSSQQTANSPSCNSGSNPPGCGTGSGLTGFYTNSTDLSTNLVSIRTDAQIDFIWGNNSPIPNVVNADGFSVRWYGQIEAPVSGNYTFKTNNDDSTRVWINGQIIIDDWNGHAPIWQQGSIYLTAGQKYDIEIDYYDSWGGAQAQFYWEYPGQSLQLVPSSRLYPKVTITPLTASIPPNIGINDEIRQCYTAFGCLIFTVDCISGKIVNFSGNILANCGDSGGSPAPFPEPLAQLALPTLVVDFLELQVGQAAQLGLNFCYQLAYQQTSFRDGNFTQICIIKASILLLIHEFSHYGANLTQTIDYTTQMVKPARQTVDHTRIALIWPLLAIPILVLKS